MDNFFTKMFHRREVSGNGTPGTITTTDPKAPENQGTATGSFADRIVSVRSPHAALTISAVYRAVGLIARTGADLTAWQTSHDGT